ncbi:MAG: Type 1 glutamine amidotransferase-like domain-containing protein [Mycobacteriales bacterium]
MDDRLVDDRLVDDRLVTAADTLPCVPHILAASAGFILSDRGQWEVGPVLRHAMALTGKEAPKVCLLHTACGDDSRAIALGYAALAGSSARASHLQLFTMPNVADPRTHLLAQDLIWVGGGSTVNLLALWRAHGLDAVLSDCWTAGVVLGGVSAGSLCWHASGTTDSFGPDLRPVTDGLGLLPYSNCPHYDSEAGRRPLYQRLVGSGALPAGWATDDGVGLHFSGSELIEAVADREGAYAWRVEPGPRPDGTALETRVTPRLLA